MDDERNIVLIGMPGVGKSTVGVLLAKALSREFIDTDLYIQAGARRRLQEIIDEEGIAEFCRQEELYVRSLDRRGAVLATGGSVVYSEAAMEHLSRTSVIVHLDLPLPLLRERLTDMGSRGVVMGPGQTLDHLYEERMPLYRRWADATVDCAGLTHEGVVDAVIAAVERCARHL